jgi:hypothetical protein
MPTPFFTICHPLGCPACVAALTTLESVRIEIVTDAGSSTVLGHVDADGTLNDPTWQVETGAHAGSYCALCGTLVPEL